MRNRRISLQDIATLAGVTEMTVSHYIRSPKKMTKETDERITKTMKEINYTLNRAPGTLLNTQSYTLGTLILSFQNQLFADILAGTESVASVYDYQILTTNYSHDCGFEEKSVINLLSYNIDGTILSEKYHTIRTAKFLRSAATPVVELIDVQGERPDIGVGFDDRQAALDMVCTMLDRRVRCKILYFGSKGGARDEQRYQGYCDAMMLHNLSSLHMSPRAILSIHLGTQLTRDAFSANLDLDDTFYTNDNIVIGALLLCRGRNLTVSEQIPIAGFHRLEVGRQTVPSLASVITLRFDIDRMAAQMLLSKIRNSDHSHNTVDLGYQTHHGNTLQVIFSSLHIFSLSDVAYTPGRKLEETS